MDITSLVAVILGIAGTLLIAFKHVRLGYAFYLPSNTLLIVYMMLVGSYDLAVMYGVYLTLTFIGLYNWRNTPRVVGDCTNTSDKLYGAKLYENMNNTINPFSVLTWKEIPIIPSEFEIVDTIGKISLIGDDDEKEHST
jgi:hypothetical protein